MIRFNASTGKVAAICLAAIFLNGAGTIVAQELQTDAHGDMFGTIFIAALGGNVPGIVVGFVTNFIGTAINSTEIYYGLVSILTAMLTAFLARKGCYEKFPNVLLALLATILLTSFVGAFVEELLNISHSFNALNLLATTGTRALHELPREFLDRGSAVMLTFLLLKFIPPDIKNLFSAFGRMQAPVSDEMHRAINAKSKFKFITSLRTKLVASMMFVTIFATGMISAISYTIYQDSAVKERIRIADGITSMVVSEINPARVDEFLINGRAAAGYSDVERALYRIRASNSDIKFLYVYKIEPDGCHVVFDLATSTLSAATPGSVEDFDESFKKYLPDLLAGRPIPPVISDDKYGYLLTIYKPVYDDKGKCTCYAAIDFSMDLINDYGRMFIAKVIAIFGGVAIFVFVIAFAFVENNIILPVNTMAYCARNFAYDSEEAREHNIDRMKNLDIRTHDEIENLYSAFLKTTADSMHYFENLKRSKIQLAVMDELAHKDALTGLKNKTAYNKEIARLDDDIAARRADFAIVMIDVNFLKRVNDTYGHEYGNIYLINAGKLVCSVFGAENVYRIGGDEFVALIVGDNLAHCDEKVSALRGTIDKLQSAKNLQPWEKISAAIGVAHYQAGVDQSADSVFKRADTLMYENKLAMKASRE